MPNLLIIAPDASNIYQIILEGFQTFTPEVKTEVMLLTTHPYKYKNRTEKVLNFLSKTFINRNIKDIYHSKIIDKRLKNLQDKYDLIFIIRPDLLSDNNLSFLKAKTSKLIAYYWDTMSFFPRKKNIIPFFDKVYSFDSQDCKDF